MSDKFLHGINFSSVKDSEHENLTPFQSYLMRRILPDKVDWDIFLNPDLKDLPSPFLLPDLTE